MIYRRPSRPARRRAGGTQPDGDVQLAEAGQQVAGVLGADVGEDVAQVVPGAEQLTLDVGAVLGEHLGDGREHAGDVAVQVDQAIRARSGRQPDPRQVDAERCRAGGDIVVQLPGDELADVLLRLLGRAADVRGEDDVRQVPQLRGEFLAAA